MSTSASTGREFASLLMEAHFSETPPSLEIPYQKTTAHFVPDLDRVDPPTPNTEHISPTITVIGMLVVHRSHVGAIISFDATDTPLRTTLCITPFPTQRLGF